MEHGTISNGEKMKEIIGYYWDSKDHYIIYQYKNGKTIRVKEKK